MRKAIFEKYGDVDTIKIIDSDIPQLSSNETLVKVCAAALNPKDILLRKGKFKRLTGNNFPQGIGFDFSGIVEDSNNSSLKKGEKVFGSLNGWKGRCCAEYLNVKINQLYKMPENISYEQAAGIPLAGQTSLQSIRDIGKLQKGDKILINGASGGVGTLAIQIAKLLGAEVTTVSSSKNLELCKSLGSDYALSYEKINIKKLVEKYNVFYDVFGNYSFKKVNHLLTLHGRYITTVPSSDIFREQFLNFFRRKKAKLILIKSKSKDLMWFYEKLLNDDIQPQVDKIFEFEEIKKAQSYIETKRAKGKVILSLKTNE